MNNSYNTFTYNCSSVNRRVKLVIAASSGDENISRNMEQQIDLIGFQIPRNSWLRRQLKRGGD